MSDNTAIEWTDATWNPVTGCTKVSPGCDHCYAETFAERWRGTSGHPYEHGFDLTLRPERLDQPLRWKRHRRIFVNSMSDLFHDDVPDRFIGNVFAVMAATPRHTYQILTKRHARMRSLLSSPTFRRLAEPWRAVGDNVADEPGWPLPNVWLGVSVEDQKWADIRIPALLETPAAVRWISAEPLLGPIDLTEVGPGMVYANRGFNALAGEPSLSWVVTGGESGPSARPAHPDWFRSIRDQCVAADVPFLFKQWGEWGPDKPVGWHGEQPSRRAASRTFLPDGTDYRPTEPDMLLDSAMATVYRIGKKAAGRELDGRVWDEYPQAVA